MCDADSSVLLRRLLGVAAADGQAQGVVLVVLPRRRLRRPKSWEAAPASVCKDMHMTQAAGRGFWGLGLRFRTGGGCGAGGAATAACKKTE